MTDLWKSFNAAFGSRLLSFNPRRPCNEIDRIFEGRGFSIAKAAVGEGLKTDVSPMWLTYFMVSWERVKQHDSDQRCTECGKPMKRTEPFTDVRGVSYEGYVCHEDRRVTWVKAG